MWEWAIVGACCYTFIDFLLIYFTPQLHSTPQTAGPVFWSLFSHSEYYHYYSSASWYIILFYGRNLLLYFRILRWSLHVLHFIFLFSGDPQWYHHHQTFNSPRIKLAASSPLGPLRPLQLGGCHHLHQVHHSILGPTNLQQPPHHRIFRLLSTGRIWEVRPLSTIHYMELNLWCLALFISPQLKK